MKMELAVIAQKENERRAKEYSKHVRRQRVKKATLETIMGILLLGSIGYVSNQEFESVLAATREIPETAEEIYLICDINNYVYNADFEGTTELSVVMPNGDYIWYAITDAPEDKCDLVVFKTNDLENYKAYEVVALR